MRLPVLVASSALALAAACGSDGGTTTTTRTVAKVTVNGANTTLNPGETTQLSAVAADATGATIAGPGIIAWSSGASTIASVDQSGKVTAVGAGTTAITADITGVKGTLSIKVNFAGSAAKDTIFTIGINAFSPNTLTIAPGTTVMFSLGFDGVGHDLRFTVSGAPADIPVTVRQNVPRTFTTAGTFPYICPTHPQMTGTITVQ